MKHRAHPGQERHLRNEVPIGRKTVENLVGRQAKGQARPREVI
jgi:hypothetical protein